MRHFDVAIVGAGPAGSTAAIALARKGYAVALLDKEQFPRDKLCGDFLNPINWPMLRELGVEEDVRSRPHEEVVTFRVTSFAGEEAEVSLPTNNGDTGFGLGLRRSDLDHVLLRKAASAGAEVLQGCRLRALSRLSQSWTLQLDHAGMIDELQAPLLIGADGRNSWIAHRLGMAGKVAKQRRSIGFQFHLKRAAGTRGKVEIHLFPGGYAGIVGIGGDSVNLCCAVERNRLPDQRPAESLLNTQLSRSPWLKEILRGERLGALRSTYPVYFPPRRAHDDGVVLVGDAARVNEPVTGEGIFFAIKSGFLAAKTIHEAFARRDFSAARLALYVRECRESFSRRHKLNAVIRLLIYQPALLAPFIRFSAKKERALHSLVRAICLP
jgi:geranylgeranyl reductase family protein